MINRDTVKAGIGMDTPKCTGAIVIGAVLLLGLLRYIFEGSAN